MSSPDQEKWDARYRSTTQDQPAACQVLQAFAHLLPRQGIALDLAAGRGGNALFLARHGLETFAWDISPVALEQLQVLASADNLSISTQARDVTLEPPEAGRFDVIVVSRFLHRAICPQLASALRPGGLLFYQTFTRAKTHPEAGPSNPDYLLARNELLRLFSGMNVIAYLEEGLTGDFEQGFRNEAWLVAQHD